MITIIFHMPFAVSKVLNYATNGIKGDLLSATSSDADTLQFRIAWLQSFSFR